MCLSESCFLQTQLLQIILCRCRQCQLQICMLQVLNVLTCALSVCRLRELEPDYLSPRAFFSQLNASLAQRTLKILYEQVAYWNSSGSTKEYLSFQSNPMRHLSDPVLHLFLFITFSNIGQMDLTCVIVAQNIYSTHKQNVAMHWLVKLRFL